MSGFSTLNTTPSFLLGENITTTHISEDFEPQFFENFHLVHDLVILILCGLGCITNPLIIIILGKQSVGSKFVYFSSISLCSLSSSKRVCEEGILQIITRVIFICFICLTTNFQISSITPWVSIDFHKTCFAWKSKVFHVNYHYVNPDLEYATSLESWNPYIGYEDQWPIFSTTSRNKTLKIDVVKNVESKGELNHPLVSVWNDSYTHRFIIARPNGSFFATSKREIFNFFWQCPRLL